MSVSVQVKTRRANQTSDTIFVNHITIFRINLVWFFLQALHLHLPKEDSR